MTCKTAILRVSDQVARNEYEDPGTQVIREIIEEELNGDIVDVRVVPHIKDEIIAALIEMSDYYKADLILTSGGTGLTPEEVTPEATMKVVERLALGFGETTRHYLYETSGYSPIFDRSIAGIRGRTLIINLPGNPKLVHQSLTALLKQLPVAIELIQGRKLD